MYIRALIVLMLLSLPASASAASLYLDPSAGTYGPGDTFIVNVHLNNGDDCVNAAGITLRYPPSSMRAVDFGKGGSIFTLWVTEPQIDTKNGVITFAGGIPGGYCGRIPGDPVLTNTIGKIVFTVVNPSAGHASIRFDPSSSVYLNDGSGTQITPAFQNATITLVPTAQNSANPWLAEVKDDTIPPEPFEIKIESTKGIFSGRYYAVFSTVDKQSGLDHYEIFESGSWLRATSPHVIHDQSLADMQIRAIDKAGNIRLGTYVAGSAPPRVISPEDYVTIFIIIAIFLAVLLTRHYLNKRDAREQPQTVDLRT